MEANCSKLTERILQLALEIIYLLTGEDNIVVLKPSGDGQNSIIVPLRSLTIPERNNNKNILEINQEIAELLTKEVPIRCQEVSIEEWKYKDVMMEDHQAATSSDGSSNGNPPERCPCPMDSLQEGDTIPHHHQGVEAIYMKTEVKEEEETFAKENHQCKKEAEGTESSLDVCTGTHEARNTPEEHLISPPDYNGENNGQPRVHSVDEASEPSQPKETSCDNRNITQREKLFSCTFPNCEKSFTNKRGLVLHQRTHISERPFPCSECKKSFLSKSELESDASGFLKETNPFSCSECEIIRHQRIHTGERPYSCSECGKSFAQHSWLIAHRRIHTRDKPFSCSECGKSFTQKSHLNTHQTVHTGEKPFSCSECGKSFTQKSHLNAHQTVHTGEKPFSCSECEKSYACKRQLRRHQRVHIGVKNPFACSECEKSFFQKANLIRHVRIHTGEKPFSCSECGKYFNDLAVRNRHLRVHTGEKPFSCSECGKCFSVKGTRDAHMNIHTGEKKFPCLKCGECFTHKKALYFHRKKHTD